MYSVVGCSECHALWIVEGRPETTQCPRCQRRHRFKKLKAFAETDTSEAAARVRSSMLADRAPDGEFVDPQAVDVDDVGMSSEEFLAASGLDTDAISAAEARASDSTGRTRSRKRVVLDALDEVEEPTADAICEYATAFDVDESYVERTLEKLRRAGEVTRVDGIYRRL